MIVIFMCDEDQYQERMEKKVLEFKKENLVSFFPSAVR